MKIKVWHVMMMIFCLSTYAFAQDDDLSRFFSEDEKDFQEFTSFEDEVRKEMGEFIPKPLRRFNRSRMNAIGILRSF